MHKTTPWLLAIAIAASGAAAGASPPASAPQHTGAAKPGTPAATQWGTPELRPFTRPAPDPACKVDAGAVRQAFGQTLNARGIRQPPEYLELEQMAPEMASFMIRLTPDDGLLPTQDAAIQQHEEAGKLQPGTNQLFLGIVYCSGSAYRMLWHITTVETGGINQGGKGDGFGTAHGVEQAVAKALASAPLKDWSPR